MRYPASDSWYARGALRGKSRQASEDLCHTALARLSKVGACPQGHSVWIVRIAGCRLKWSGHDSDLRETKWGLVAMSIDKTVSQRPCITTGERSGDDGVGKSHVAQCRSMRPVSACAGG